MAFLQLNIWAALALLSIYYVIRKITSIISAYRFRKAHGCLPPKMLPQSERILGLDFFRKRKQEAKENRLLQAARQRYIDVGNTFSFTLLGETMISTIEPENIKAILSTQFDDFCLGERANKWRPFAGDGVFTTDGAHWQHSREMIRPNFTRAQVADLDTFEKHIQVLISKIPEGETVDLQPLFFRLALDSSSEFLMGESVDSLSRGDLPPKEDFGYLFDYGLVGLSNRQRLGPLYWTYRDSMFDYACKFCHTVIDKFVYKALEMKRQTKSSQEKDGKYIFLEELAKRIDDPLALRSEAMNIMIAGRDTTASLLSNLFVTLAKRPDVWNKLHMEVEELNGALPDYETLKNMKYLKMVLNEALRLYPPVPANFRSAVRDTTIPLGGGPDGKSPVFIPKGTSVNYNVYSMHRRHDIYGPDAEEFKPERWGKLRPGWGYLPFNGGPRICIGQQYALTEAGYTVVRLMQKFSTIEDREPRPWNARQHLTIRSLHGTKVALRR
ncbi:putative cytochrome P450 alkane hydroxylase [Xylogone sp. PMI_703]|nr:putative cytochrome P450 alkane hydroxylase [Xylogone sp. PMI_703]